jgi:hypothetical protein
MMARAFTDMGNVSQVLPAIPQPEFANATIASAAEAAIAQGALALVGTIVDAAAHTNLRRRLLSNTRP